MLAGSLVAPGTSAAQAFQGMPPVEVIDSEGQQTEGLLKAISPDEVTLILSTGNESALPRESLLEIHWTQAGQPEDDLQQLILLTNGDRLAGRVLTIDEEAVHLHWQGNPALSALAIPLELVKAVVLSLPRRKMERELLTKQWSLHESPHDRLLLRAGTTIDGEFEELTESAFHMQTSLGPVETMRDDVAAFAANPKLQSDLPPPTSYVLVETLDGSWISLEDLHIRDDRLLIGRTLWQADITIPESETLRVRLYGPRVKSLCDLTPSGYEFTPYLTQTHPLVTNRNVHGGWLRTGGTTRSRGLGVHSRSAVSYDLGGEYERFESLIGVDDMAEQFGSVTFTVEVDEQVLFESGRMTGADLPRTTGPIPLAGARELRLIVDFADYGNIQDIADWCHPILIK